MPSLPCPEWRFLLQSRNKELAAAAPRAPPAPRARKPLARLDATTYRPPRLGAGPPASLAHEPAPSHLRRRADRPTHSDQSTHDDQPREQSQLSDQSEQNEQSQQNEQQKAQYEQQKAQYEQQKAQYEQQKAQYEQQKAQYEQQKAQSEQQSNQNEEERASIANEAEKQSDEKYEIEIIPQTFTLLDPATQDLLTVQHLNEERRRALELQSFLYDDLIRQQRERERLERQYHGVPLDHGRDYRFDLDPFGRSRL
ncbi:unnamed protein product [Colias eurytheme]|nr:unnamed protein product [Colias eurytheme]